MENSNIKKIVLLIIASVLFVTPLVIYFYNFNGGFSTEHSKWSEFGSYLGGIYGALAFFALAYTTNITRKQFKIQNEDSVFFKLYDSLQNRISIATLSIDGNKYSAHQLIKMLADKFYSELSEESVEIARLLLAKRPESISNTHYGKIFKAINGEGYLETLTKDKDSLIQDINSQVDFNSRWEQLKNYIGSRGGEGENLKKALRATGSVNFYKIPFSERICHYKNVYQRLSIEYGEFLDGYFKVSGHSKAFYSPALYPDTVTLVQTQRGYPDENTRTNQTPPYRMAGDYSRLAAKQPVRSRLLFMQSALLRQL